MASKKTIDDQKAKAEEDRQKITQLKENTEVTHCRKGGFLI